MLLCPAVHIWCSAVCGEEASRPGGGWACLLGGGPLLEDATVWNIARGKSKFSLRECPKISALCYNLNDAAVLSLSVAVAGSTQFVSAF